MEISKREFHSFIHQRSINRSQDVIGQLNGNRLVEGCQDKLVREYAPYVGAIVTDRGFIGTCFRISPQHLVTNFHVATASKEVSNNYKGALHCVEKIEEPIKPPIVASETFATWIQEGVVTLGESHSSIESCLSYCATGGSFLQEDMEDYTSTIQVEGQTELSWKVKQLANWLGRAIVMFDKRTDYIFLPDIPRKVAPLMFFHNSNLLVPVVATQEYPPPWSSLYDDDNTRIIKNKDYTKFKDKDYTNTVLQICFNAKYQSVVTKDLTYPLPWKAVFSNTIASHKRAEASVSLVTSTRKMERCRSSLLSISKDVKNFDTALLKFCDNQVQSDSPTSYLIPWATSYFPKGQVMVIGFGGEPVRDDLGWLSEIVDEADHRRLRDLCHPNKKSYGYGRGFFLPCPKNYPFPIEGHHQVTTVNGNSGSLVIDTKSGRWIGTRGYGETILGEKGNINVFQTVWNPIFVRYYVKKVVPEILEDNRVSELNLQQLHQYIFKLVKAKCRIFRDLHLWNILHRIESKLRAVRRSQKLVAA